MPRLFIAVFAIATAAVGLLPAAAQASVTQSQITSWVTVTTDPQGHTSETTNGTYLLSLDNPPAPTTIDVKGTATGSSVGDLVDIVCFYGTGGSAELKTNLAVGSGGAFDTRAIPLRPIAGHACRLRAIPAGDESTSDVDSFAGPQVAVSEAALPLSTISGSGSVNAGKAYNYYVNDVTLSGWAAWKAVGTNGCGPYAAPIDSTLNVGNFAIDCAGSLLADDLGAWGGRSEVQIDGRNAYDAASAQALIPRTGGVGTGTEDLANFPSLGESLTFDPTTGLISSTSQESFVSCAGADRYKPTMLPRDCPNFVDTGVTLQRTITTSDGGRVVRMTDAWTSTDGASHAVDVLYDDYVGLSTSSAVRGYEFPGAGTFSSYLAVDPLPGPAAGPGSIFVHTNQGASDGNTAEAFGAITYATAPSGFHFAPAAPPAPTAPPPSNEFEERAVASVPAGGTASLSYVYSVGYSLADVQSLALAAQDGFEPLVLTIDTSAGNTTLSSSGSTTVSTSTITLTGKVRAGSGIKSLVVGGQPVAIASDGSWSVTVALNPGLNTIPVVATDEFGATTQTQVIVYYQPPPPLAVAALPSPPPATCHVPKIKGMKLRAAEKALRRAHCRVGRIRRVTSNKMARGRVVSSTPGAGRHLPGAHKIELFVSSGP